MKRIIQISIAALFMLCGSLSHAQTDEPKALLYEITGNGLTKPSYLYGTMHVSNKIAYNLSDSFFVALKSVDMVALEVNPDSFMNYAMKYNLNYVSPSVRYSTGYGNFYELVSELPELDLDILRGMLADIDQLSNFLMFRRSSFTMNYEEGTYLDLFLYQSGKKLKKSIGHVEDYNEANELEVLSYQRDEESDDYPDYEYDPDAKPFNEQVDDAYRNRDVKLLDSLIRKTSTKNHYKYFLVERNKNQADALAELMKTKSVFCGVGVAHLGGDSGVVNLLRMKGYTVMPVAQPSSRGSNKMVEQINKIDYPLTFSSFTSQDGLFSVSMPGDVYTVYADNSRLMYYCPEMVNGAYYQVVRIRSKEYFNGITPEEKLSQVDSLLYEAMPGKITSKKKIQLKDGLAGFDVISVTPNGNWIRTQVFAREHELVIFKVRGEDKYALEKNGNTFFSSIRFAPAASENMTTYINHSLGVQLDIPANRIEHDISSTGARSRTPQLLRLEAFDNGGKQHYRFILAGLHDFSYLESDTFELKAIVKEFFDDLDIEEFNQSLGSNESGLYACGDAKKDGMNYFVRSTLKGTSYALLAFSSTDSILPEKFFSSFRWVDYKYQSDFAEVSDTAMHFKTKTILNDVNIFSRTLYNRSMSSSSMFFGSQNLIPTKKALTLYGTTTTETFSSSETPEFVEVTFKRFPKYASYDTTTLDFFNSSDMYFGYYSSDPFEGMKKKTLKEIKDGGNLEYYFCYSDTGVSRMIHVKYFLKAGALYTLKAVCDSTEGLTGWTKAFFENFEPADTTFGMSLLLPKGNLYLDDFTSSDSLTKAIAREVESYIEFDESSAEKLTSFIRSDEFKNLKESERETMLDFIGHIESPGLTDALTEIYKSSVDSVALQHSILSALARQKTRKSFDAVLSLMEFDIPLADDYETFYDIYSPMFDTLELVKPMFPALLDYTRYPEHKKYIYGLMLALNKKKLIPSSIVAGSYRSILSDANEEFKRVKAEGLNNYDDYFAMEWFTDYLNTGTEEKKKDLDTVCFEIQNAELFEVLMELLMGDYSTNQQTRAFFDKVINTRQDEIIFATLVVLEKNKVPTPDSLWTALSSKPEMLMDVYRYLKKNNKLHLMDSACLNQQYFAYARVYSDYEKEDSVVFIKSETETIHDVTGIVYYFKTKEEDDKSWKLAFSGPYPTDGSLPLKVELTESSGETIGKKSNGDKEIKEARKEFYYHKRERASGSYYGSFY